MRLDDAQVTVTGYKDRVFSGNQIIAAFDGTASARTTIPATYETPTITPTVYYTALDPGGSVITPRGVGGVTLLASGLYQYLQPRSTDFVAVWDEGDPLVYTSEYVVVGQ